MFDFGFWCSLITLIFCSICVCGFPAWWRDWSFTPNEFWDRAYGVNVTGFLLLAVGTLAATPVADMDLAEPWLYRFCALMWALSGLLFLSIPLVGLLRAFDFAVPPRLRYGPRHPAQGAWDRAAERGNRAERRRRRLRPPGAGR